MTPIRPKLSQTMCLECGSKKEISSNGYIICRNCGIAKTRSYVDHLPIKIDENQRLISHNSIGKSPGYIGTLGSDIGFKGDPTREIRGKRLNPKAIYKYQRLSKFYQKRSRIGDSGTHLRTIVIFNRICGQLDISEPIKQRSLYLYWKYSDTDIEITNHVLLVALCLLTAVREAGDRAPIRFSEIITVFADNGHRVTNKNILRLARELDLNLAPTRRRAEDYIERIAISVRENSEIRNRLTRRPIKIEEYELLLVKTGLHFLSLLDRKDRGGVQPFPFAVSITYLADRAISKYFRRRPILTQKLLADAANSAEFTIRDHVYRFLGDLYHKHEVQLVDFVETLF